MMSADVTVVAEERFPVEAAASDATLQALVHESGPSSDELLRTAAGVRSAGISALKPAK